MKIIKCKNCGIEVAKAKTQKGKSVICEVYWDGEFKMYIKNHQPTPHNCTYITKRRNTRD